MRVALLAVCAVVLVASADAIFILGTAGTTGTIAAGTAAGAAGLAALGGLALGVGIVGAVALASRRGKRSVEMPLKREGLMWDMVSATDIQGCALKFVCLVQATSDDDLDDDQALVSSLFSRGLDGVDFDHMQTSKGAYFYAAFMGEKFGADSCNKLFHRCEHNMAKMLEYFHSLITSEE